MIELFSGQHLRATCLWPDRPRLIVRFDIWRASRNGFPEQSTGSVLEPYGCACLTIHTARNDWFLNPDLPELRRVLRGFCADFTSVTGFGFSMGGYAALLFAPDLNLGQAVLVSPQYSIRPELAPFENRYRHEAQQIEAHRHRFDTGHGRTLRGALLYDPLWGIDRQHQQLICSEFPALWPVPLWAGGHPAVKIIHDAGKWPNFLQEVAAETVRPGRFLRLHKAARESSEIYFQAMAERDQIREDARDFGT
ncbi:MAG: alpha/beta hydrolase [Rhodobacteraceae bacterium]|nr:alpha/beta hydrolase [Paracoccaceae bacterium]